MVKGNVLFGIDAADCAFRAPFLECQVLGKIDVAIGKWKGYPSNHVVEHIEAARGSQSPHEAALDCKS